MWLSYMTTLEWGRSLTDSPESLTAGSDFKIECHRAQSRSHDTGLGGQW
jgi:hypothetical protein